MGLGKNLTTLREAQGFSRTALARQLGIPYTTLRNYETDQREPGHRLLIQIARLLSISVDALVGYEGAPSAPAVSHSPEAEQLARDYDGLDDHGKRVVQVVLREEQTRLSEEGGAQAAHAPPESQRKVIPLYLNPAAAGYTSPVFGEDFEYIPVENEVPPAADFAVKISGDSMEPYLMDGSVAYINRDPLSDGDVGVFYVDGDLYCKQYHRDEIGMVYLFSLNRKRADADILLSPSGNRSLVCFGRVLLPARPPLPQF